MVQTGHINAGNEWRTENTGLLSLLPSWERTLNEKPQSSSDVESAALFACSPLYIKIKLHRLKKTTTPWSRLQNSLCAEHPNFFFILTTCRMGDCQKTEMTRKIFPPTSCCELRHPLVTDLWARWPWIGWSWYKSGWGKSPNKDKIRSEFSGLSPAVSGSLWVMSILLFCLWNFMDCSISNLQEY